MSSTARGGARRGVAAFSLFASACAAAPVPESPAVAWPDASVDRLGAVRVALARDEVPAGAPLVVRVDDPDAPPLPGRVVARVDALEFVPRFAWTPGLGYVVELDRRVLGRHVFPAPELMPETVVVGVFPSEPVVPQNVLRMYVAFSAPMSRGLAYEHVRVEDASGRRVDAFLPVEPELWDPDGTRLTLLFDPGRIKRGLARNLDLGAPLLPGARYVLVVDPAWPDARGAPLARGIRHEFETAEPDRVQPDATLWTLETPAAHGRAPLVARFDAPLDHALLLRMLTVRGPDGAAVAGRTEPFAGERGWSFTPRDPWRPGEYALVADPLLEDPAGNSFARPFEVDLEADPGSLRRPAERDFRVDEVRGEG